jgi:gamma-butyrobetaine dioxygenase
MGADDIPGFQDMMIVASIFDLLEEFGREAYLREGVSQREHALQAAALAEAEGAVPDLVVAALLHDVGHLLAQRDGASSANGKLAALPHEQVGAAWLEPLFGPAITEPIRLHVEAKRYLCALEPDYVKQLTEGSLRRLAAQGGALTRSEIRDFQENPYHRAAVWLRRIDDRACDATRINVPGFEHYRARLEMAIRTRRLALETARHSGGLTGAYYCQIC